MRTKEWRKNQTKRLQKKRLKVLDHTPSERQKGRYKKGHVGCGCMMCKPWKHKMEADIKISDKKRLESNLEPDTEYDEHGWEFNTDPYDDWKEYPFITRESTGGKFIMALKKLEILPKSTINGRYFDPNYELLEKLAVNPEGIIWTSGDDDV